MDTMHADRAAGAYPASRTPDAVQAQSTADRSAPIRELAAEAPDGTRVPVTLRAAADNGAVAIDLDAPVTEALGRGPLAFNAGDVALKLEQDGHDFRATAVTADGLEQALPTARTAPAQVELRFDGPATEEQITANGLGSFFQWLRYTVNHTVPNDSPATLEDANDNGRVDGADRTNPMEEPAPRELVSKAIADRLPASGGVVLLGEAHDYTNPVRAHLVTLVQTLTYDYDRSVVVAVEKPEQYFDDVFDDLNDRSTPIRNEEWIKDDYRDAVEQLETDAQAALPLWQRLLTKPASRAPSLMADFDAYVDIRNSGATIHPIAPMTGRADATMAEHVEQLRAENPDAVIIVWGGLLHAQTQETSHSHPAVDQDNPLGKRLEATYGEDSVVSVLFQPLHPRSYDAPNGMAFDQYDMVVPTPLRFRY